MKKIIFLIIFLLFVPAVYAPSINNVEILINDPFVIGGKTITLLSLTDEKILLDIDGSKKIIKAYGRTKAEDISFTIVGIFLDEEKVNTYVKFNISMDYVCGNNICEEGENNEICCKDCSCSNDSICLNNKCIEGNCGEDKDCDDGISCTVDGCLDNYCVNELITECKDNDGCCLEDCNYYNDKDCEAPPPLPEIECEDGTIQHRSYCKNNSWIFLKEAGEICESDYECSSGYCNYEKCFEVETILTGRSMFPTPEKKNLFHKLLDLILSFFSKTEVDSELFNNTITN
jgi:hypothetical protein